MSFKLLTRKGECYQKHTIEIGKNFSSKALENIKQMYYYIGIKTFDRKLHNEEVKISWKNNLITWSN